MFHLSELRELIEQLPAQLLPRSELPKTILVFAVAHRSEVLGLWHIYYLYNCYVARIYFFSLSSNVPHILLGHKFPVR